jgi:Tol biopolymer transport system component
VNLDLADAWSPDGRHIAFASHHDGISEICVVSDDGTAHHDLTRWAGTFDTDVDWQPSREQASRRQTKRTLQTWRAGSGTSAA